MVFQYATVREFCGPVEQITGRKVRAYTSAIDTYVDGLCVETFILHPADAWTCARCAHASAARRRC